MIFLFVAALCLITCLLAGGDIKRVEKVSFRTVRLPVIALAVQVAVFHVHAALGLLSVAYMATVVGVLSFLWINRRIPGIGMAFAGTVSNGIAMTLNGGKMPASATALRQAGIDSPRSDAIHQLWACVASGIALAQ